MIEMNEWNEWMNEMNEYLNWEYEENIPGLLVGLVKFGLVTHRCTPHTLILDKFRIKEIYHGYISVYSTHTYPWQIQDKRDLSRIYLGLLLSLTNSGLKGFITDIPRRTLILDKFRIKGIYHGYTYMYIVYLVLKQLNYPIYATNFN